MRVVRRLVNPARLALLVVPVTLAGTYTASAAQPDGLPMVFYVGPPSWGEGAYTGGPVDPAIVHLSTWAAGEKVYAATDGAKLRDAPRTDGRVVHTAGFGTAFTILRRATPTPVDVSARVDHWYEARHESGAVGFVFGGVVTPVLLRLPGERLATVAWRWDFEVCLRTFAGGRETSHCQSMGGNLKGGAARAWVAPAPVTNPDRPLIVLEVELGMPEPETTRWYYVYRLDDGQPSEVIANYAHTYDSGVYGYLLISPDHEALCSGFINPTKLDICRRTADGKEIELQRDLAQWTRVPAQKPRGLLVPPRAAAPRPAAPPGR